MKNFVLAAMIGLSATAMASECDITRSYSKYYVTINGNYMSDAATSFSTAVRDMYELNRYGMCSLPVPSNECKVERSYSKYYVTLNGNYISGSIDSLRSVRSVLNERVEAGLCFYPQARDACEVQRSYGKFYVIANGSYVTAGHDNIGRAFDDISRLESLGVCYNGSAPAPRQPDITPIPRRDGGYGLGFNFRSRALFIATTVVNVSRAMEGFVNNDQEREIDEIKIKAIRLRSKINAGASLQEVRNAMYYLWYDLNNASGYIESALETDRLDSLGEDYLTSLDSLTVMINFLDNTFTGQRQELY
ncbi:MAG: hypothetical protein CME65_06970 [Halobacteriovoraceae bacterium]|nr:hypothetical protein [Halobacteriovoraceae bacterium]